MLLETLHDSSHKASTPVPKCLPCPFRSRWKALPSCSPSSGAAKEERTQEQIVYCWELMQLHWSHRSYTALDQEGIWPWSHTEDNGDISRE